MSQWQNYISPPEYQDKVIYPIATNTNIIDVIHRSYKKALGQTKQLAQKLKGNNSTETARNIWNFLKSEFQYKADPKEFQKIRLPSRAIFEKSDCKSFSLMAASLLGNLGMPVAFRYASYKSNNPTPSHVYVVTKDEKGNEIIVDGVYKYFNQQVPYKHKKDYKMEVSALSGYDEIGRVRRPRPLKKLAERRQRLKNCRCARPAQLLSNIGPVRSIPLDIEGIGKKGKFFKKLAPKKMLARFKKFDPGFFIMRKAFLSLVALNVRGLAWRLNQLSDDELKSIWEKKFGGKLKVLKQAIKNGRHRKAILGTGKKGKAAKRQYSGPVGKKNFRRSRSVNGVMFMENEISGIGVAPAVAAPAWVAVASAVIAAFTGLLNKKGVKEPPILDEEGNPVQGDILSDAIKLGGSLISNAVENGNTAAGSAADQMTNSAENLPGDEEAASTATPDEKGGVKFGLNPLMIGGLAIAAIFLLKKGK